MLKIFWISSTFHIPLHYTKRMRKFELGTKFDLKMKARRIDVFFYSSFRAYGIGASTNAALLSDLHQRKSTLIQRF